MQRFDLKMSTISSAQDEQRQLDLAGDTASPSGTVGLLAGAWPEAASHTVLDSTGRMCGKVEPAALVSILIPAHNAEEWIGDAIRSAIAQTWPRIEIIIVDDGSTDGTLAIARQFESQGVQVAAQRSQGAAAARNKAFSLSHGDYIQWLDADDLLAPDKIARQMEVVQQGASKRTLLSSPWAPFMFRASRARFIPSPLWCDLSRLEWLLRKMEQNVYMQTATWLVSRELTEAAGPWDIRLLGDDDGEYFCRVLLASDGVRFVPDARVYYRALRSDSLSCIGVSRKKIAAHWISMQLHIRYLRSLEDSPRTRAACLQFLRDSLIYFYPESLEIVSQAEKIATGLGQSLGAPNLSWKYSWIRALFGWRVAKSVQRASTRLRWSLARHFDKALFEIENLQHSSPGFETGGRQAVSAGPIAPHA